VGEPAIRPARELHGLSHALTSFVGRSSAVDKVAGLLSQYRLVTVTGPGGVGKTRLADEVLKRVADRFADGVWVVELAAIHEATLVPAMVATVLELRQATDVPVADALAAHLARQQMLLVLDNCEHVLDAVAQLCAALLLSADDIRILATSREPLGLPEEARYRLPPLTLPAPSAQAQDGPAEAVTLFIQRARQVDPDLAFDGDSAAMIERLVRRLDGMPLAIELAAARVEVLGLAQLLDRLDDRFRVLISANRGTAARQRSLEAAVDWSYQLLSGPEQQVFRHLSVFPGPFTLDAAEAVAGSDAGAAVLRLVDCSLLVAPRAGPDGRSRYSMLETLRSYGMGRLRQAGEERQAASALTGHALQVAERAAAQMTAPDLEQPAAHWLDAEDAALHQGLAWALEYDPPVALRLALALAPWWLVRGRWVQGYALLHRAVAQAGPGEGNWYTAHLWLGHLAFGGINFGVIVAHYSTAVDALRDRPPSADLIDGLTGRCHALRNMGRLDEAEADARVALDLARQLGYPTGEADALKELSAVFTYANDGEHAVEWARQAQRVDRSQMPGWRAREVERILAWALATVGDHEDFGDALDLCAQALVRARTMGDLGAQANLFFIMEVLALKTERLPEARMYLRETAELATHLSSTLRLVDILDEGGFLCAATGQYAEAVTLWSALAAQNQANDLADTLEGEHRRDKPLREARDALETRQVRAAEERGAAMTLPAAVQLAVMTTDDNRQVPTMPAGTSALSARERELVALVAQGRTDAEMADKLFISVRTVRTHLDRIRDKSGCRRRADLTRLALQEGII
jgi:predicted ATPase/DNA-binding CsgD family transcriptional regulator